ncbi:hypothetical protein FQN57_001708, partial [Myotisia sp. PD_48]
MDSDPPLPSPPRLTRTALAHPDNQALSDTTPVKPLTRPKWNLKNSFRRRGSGAPSSDPPFFSSDDFQCSALENYNSAAGHESSVASGSGSAPTGRRKRRYRGTWWGEKVETRAQPKKLRSTVASTINNGDGKATKRTGFKAKRNFDSGVWLGSADADEDPGSELSVGLFTCGSEDSTLGDEDATIDESMAPFQMVNPVEMRYTIPFSVSANKLRDVRESEPHRKAREAINQCLEEGSDRVDLSNFDMQVIPADLLRPLAQLTREPMINHEAPPTDDLYTPFEPSLQLFLGCNLLTYIPKGVFELENLKVLSLRQNKLTELPGAIGKLTQLQDLNVSGNRLQYLPWELLSLMHKGELKHLKIHPNKFGHLPTSYLDKPHDELAPKSIDNKPFDTEGHTDYTYYYIPDGKGYRKFYMRASSTRDARKPLYFATSSVEYCDSDGHPIRNPSAGSGLSSTSPRFFRSPPSDSSTRHTQGPTPSLRELALKACSRSPHLPHYLEALQSRPSSPSNAPFYSRSSPALDELQSHSYSDPILRLLEKANEIRLTGEKRCST